MSGTGTPVSSPRAPAFVIGLVIGVVSGGITGVLATYLVGRSILRQREMLREQSYAQVVVAERDLPAQTVITFDDISQRAAQRYLVTSSIVKPAVANRIVGHRLLTSVQAGDMILWSQLGLKHPVSILVAARDIPAGTALSSADVEEKDVQEEAITDTYLRSAARSKVIGSHVNTSIPKAHPLLSTHF
jgi:Flp pilus assembly protein CpaB